MRIIRFSLAAFKHISNISQRDEIKSNKNTRLNANAHNSRYKLATHKKVTSDFTARLQLVMTT